jgi:hypothetical protein
VQRGIHVAGVDRKESDPESLGFLGPDGGEVLQGGLAGAVGAPAGVGGRGGVAGDVHDQGAAAVARRGGEGAEERLGQAERADEIHRERLLEVLAVGVGEQSERHRAEAGGAVDQHVEAAEVAGDLQGDRMDVVLAADVADNAGGAGVPGGFGDSLGGAGDEGDARALGSELADQREAEAGGAAGDGDAKGLEVGGWHSWTPGWGSSGATSSSGLEVKRKMR